MSPFDSTQSDNPLQVLRLKDGTTTTVDKVYNYFAGIFAAEESGKDFPVRLDHVWKLAYTRIDHAVHAISEMNFQENIDYVLLPIPRDQTSSMRGGHNRKRYMLSVQATEHLIARKVTEIFEIYRQCRIEVTRRARAQKESSAPTALGLAKQMLVALEEQESRLARVERDVQDIYAERHGSTGFRTLLGYCIMKDLHFGKVQLSVWGRKLSAYCRRNEIVFHQVDSENYDKIGSYPIWVIEETFDALGPKPEKKDGQA